MDLSRAKAEQNSPAADKGRWVQRQETELESYIYIAVSDLCYRNLVGGKKRSDGRSNIQGVILRAIFGLKIQQRMARSDCYLLRRRDFPRINQ